MAQQLVEQHFLAVELYDRNKQLQLETIRRGKEVAEQGIERYRHRFPQMGEFSHEFHFIRGELLLVILVPLKDVQDSLTGYFEGIYRVDRQTIDSIRDDLLRTLLFVSLGITFTTFLMYPIILTLNRGLIELSGDLLKGNLELMNVLGCAIAERDSDTNSHNYRVTFPLNARIFAIVDVFDALTSKRPYKESWTVGDAIAMLERDSGSHFDPRLVKVFVKLAPDLYRKISGVEEHRLEAMLQHSIARYFLTTAIGVDTKI